MDDLQELPFVARSALLTNAERDFFAVLDRVIGDRYHVWPMTRLWDLVDVPRGTKGRGSFENQIRQKHVDFVLCSRGTFAPVLAIELDDRSHDQQKRIERDALLEGVLAAAGIPLARFRVRAKYDAKTLLQKVRRAIDQGGLAMRTEAIESYRGRILDELPE